MTNRPNRTDPSDQKDQGLTGERPVIDFDLGRPIKSYLSIVYLMIADPKTFFRFMSVDGGFRPPWMFAVFSVLIPWLGVVVFYQSVYMWLFLPMALLVFLVMAGLVHLSATALMGGRGAFQATFRVAAFTSFTMIPGPIAYLGLAAHLFGLYLTAYGLAAVHRMSLLRGALAILIIEGILRLLQYQIMDQVFTGQ